MPKTHPVKMGTADLYSLTQPVGKGVTDLPHNPSKQEITADVCRISHRVETTSTELYRLIQPVGKYTAELHHTTQSMERHSYT